MEEELIKCTIHLTSKFLFRNNMRISNRVSVVSAEIEALIKKLKKEIMHIITREECPNQRMELIQR